MRIGFIGDYNSVNTKSWLSGLKKADPKLNIEIYPFDFKRYSAPFTQFKILFLQRRKIISWIKENNIELLIGYRTTSFGFVAASTGFHPLVVACQGETDLYGGNILTKSIRSIMKRYAVKKADLIHAWGHNQVPSLIQHGGLKEKILVLPRGVDLNTFKFKLPVNKNFGVDCLHLVITRSIEVEYMHLQIILAIKKLIDLGYNLKLHIIGTGSQKENMETLVKNLNISNYVKFHGRIKHRRVSELLAFADVYISLTKTEGVSMSLIEAMAIGLYPIVSNLNGNKIWINDNENGNLIDNKDVISDLRTKIEAFVSLDYKKRKIIAINNRRMVETHGDISNNMKVFLKNYNDLITKKYIS